ncbi:conserved hypothetical protein [Histoplasma capsulatum H143]|uniref:Uncharacterized protein n=1 Tax=Ajellomyces capsulatus (strain H143) TaxID=544712 RepID=C6H459_AJECH|nr:conserved hypothetical protein [Histoplasma capsulatum H143]
MADDMMDIDDEEDTNRNRFTISRRLLQRTASASSVGNWIYTRNPAISNLEPHSNQDVSNFRDRDTKLLETFNNQRNALHDELHDRSWSILEQRISIQRRMPANKIPSSKWVLFPSLRQVDRAWRIVAESTARGQLGIGAKVATDGGGSGFGGANQPRLI